MNELTPAETGTEPELSPQPHCRQSRRRMLGPTLWIFGAALWAYVVMGEIVVRADSVAVEALAVAVVLGTLIVTWRSAARLPAAGKRRVVHSLAPGLLAIALLVALPILVSQMLGPMQPRRLQVVTVALWVLSVIAVLFGRVLTGVPKRTGSSFRRVARWSLSALVTIFALISALSDV